MKHICRDCGEIHPAYITCERHQEKKRENSSAQKQPQIDDNSKPEPTPRVEEEKPQKAVKPHQSYDPNASERAKRWRENNPDRHKEYMRDYMRRRRNQ